ncbi:MAG: hypothetical protein IID54_03260 [Proteobacteria bacterium]|nr:hypothetical protein [Pseudomonadota bacterium]
MDRQMPDGLSLEYKRDYGTALRKLDITDVSHEAVSQGVVCVFGPGFSEKVTDLPFVKIGVFPNDGADSSLILQDAV